MKEETDLNDSLTFLTDAIWHSEPPSWRAEADGLWLVTGNETDFWQDTFYGFHRDDGHFYGSPATGDFTAIVTFTGEYEVLYDQAGLMMRADVNNWMKTGVEFSDDVTNFSAVITREGKSDWSVVSVPRVTGPQKVRLTRLGGAVIVHFLTSDGTWQLLRLGNFPEDADVRIGPMACSPQRAGFKVNFHAFEVAPPISKPLHGD